MRGTVHGLERHVLLTRLVVVHEEHVLAVFPPVARLLPQGLAEQQRRPDLDEVLLLAFADEPDHLVEEDRPTFRPERRTRRHRIEEEEVERAAQHAVVAPLRFLDAMQVRLEVLLRPERGGVDALQHLAAFVATPIRPGGVEQLEVLQVRRVRDVRAAAEIDKGPVRVGGDHLVGTKVADPLELEWILGEASLRFGAIDLLAEKRILLRDHLAHFLLERGQVLRRERLLDLEVVVEAVLDRGTESDVRFRPQAPDGRGQDVGAGVPEDRQRLGIPLRQNAEGIAAPKRRHQVLHRLADLHGDGIAQQARPDRGHHVPSECTRRHLALGSVRQREGDRFVRRIRVVVLHRVQGSVSSSGVKRGP